jgi:hypothetical protein
MLTGEAFLDFKKKNLELECDKTGLRPDSLRNQHCVRGSLTSYVVTSEILKLV